MLSRIPLWSFLSLALALTVLAEEPKAEPAKIREFPVETLASLGRQIYFYDSLGWQATDILLAKHSQEQLQNEGDRGYVVDITTFSAPFVRFIREKDGKLQAAYDVVFRRGKQPQLIEPKDKELTAEQKIQMSARSTAIKLLTEGKLPWRGENPNFVVLPDPDGSGFLVYVLRPKATKEEIPVGGHYRVTVSADGQHVEQVDRLFASWLTLSRTGPQGQTVEALTMSHIVSDTPLETHVFLSLQEKLPFYVSAGDKVWKIEKGKISLLKSE